MPNLYDFELDSIEGEPVALGDFEGQTCLIVNVASE